MTETGTTPHSVNAAPGRGGRASRPSVFTNILCGVDGTSESTEAVELAAMLAGPNGSLTLLAVTGVRGSGVYETAIVSPDRVELVLGAAQLIADDAGVRATAVVDPGGPTDEVMLERASDHDLLALGAPASWLNEVLIGGAAKGVLSRFATPMVLARAPVASGSLRGGRILVASDGNEGSDRIVELAGRLGASVGAQVTLVNALGPESEMHPHRIEAQVRALELELPGASEATIEPGGAFEVVLETANRKKAAMVVIGSRRLRGLRALSSVSARVVRDAPCSVLLVPLEDRQAPRP